MKLTPFKIGNILIPNRFVLAPMAGITNEAFRRICKEMGCGLVVAEMVSDKAIGFHNERTLKMTEVNPLEHPISMQIFGGELASLVQAAKYIDLNSNADIIDINMGCPVNKVAKKSQAGAALLQNPELIYNIVKEVVQNVSKPVTVKMRIGWDFDSINAVEVAKKIEEAGASAITVHGRTRSQFYTGKADLEWIKKVKEAVHIPVIGNGDIIDIDSAVHMFEYTGVDAIAIGRGALGNPFIFRELKTYFETGERIAKPTNEEIYHTILKQYEMLKELKGERLAMLEMRSHVAWYIKGKPGSAKIKDLCNKQIDFQEVCRILKEYLAL